MAIINKFAALNLLAAKQKIGDANRDEIELPVRLHLEVLRRGQANPEGENFIVFNVTTALLVANAINNRALYDLGAAAYGALARGSLRDSDVISLTTAEFKAVRLLVNRYFSIMPILEIGIVRGSAEVAMQRLNLTK